MTLMKVELNLGMRRMAQTVLNQLEVIDRESYRAVREVRQRFDMRSLTRETEQLATGYDLSGLPSDAAEELSRLRSQVRALYELCTAVGGDIGARVRQLVPTIEDAVEWDALLDSEVRTFTIDDAYSTWLHEQVKKKNWAQVRINTNQGAQTVDVVRSAQELISIADLEDALANAKLAKGE